ncbi:MAG: ABC transporter ATP-binding protein [Planctomycetes bacterium]|nr:ABC transporter ATP-binding protein [Planctomycetota bacterium]
MRNKSKKQILFYEIKQTFAAKKLRWIFAFFAMQLIPLLEVIFISCIYLILNKEKQELLLSKIDSLSLANFDFSGLSEVAVSSIVFVIALVLLFFNIALRYINEMNLITLKYFFYVRDSQRLISSFLYSSTSSAHRIGKETITDSIIRDCGTLSNNTHLFMGIFGAACSILLYIAGGVLLSWKILLVAMMLYVFPLWANRKVYSKMQNIGQLKVRTHERVLKFFTDILSGYKRSKLDGLESSLEDKSGKILKKSQNWRIKKRKTQARFLITMDGLSLLSLLIILFVGISFISLSLSTLMIVFVIFNRMKAYVTTITNSMIKVREQIPNIYRYFDLLESLKTKGPSFNQITPINETSFSKIEMKNVDFGYDDEFVLNNINFMAQAGDRILIQGPSGQGKSTFLEILCGILPPSRGTVLFDDNPLNETLFYKIRPFIVYASPTVYLFEDTLLANLTMGSSFTEKNLNEAITLSGLQEVVSELPNGLDSYIGSNGDTLSLGQRQRVILARLYLKKPKLILLDEATANLDTKMENQIIKNLLSFVSANSILIMVAHKEPKGMDFNKRFIMKNGQLSTAAIKV